MFFQGLVYCFFFNFSTNLVPTCWPNDSVSSKNILTSLQMETLPVDWNRSMSRMFNSGISNRQKILSKNQWFLRGLSKHIYLIILPNDAAQFHRHSFNCFLCCQITSINCSTVIFKIFFSFLMRPKPGLFCTVRKSIQYLHILSSIIKCSHQWWNTL